MSCGKETWADQSLNGVFPGPGSCDPAYKDGLWGWGWGLAGTAVGEGGAPQNYRTFSSLGWEDPLEKEMATHSSILAWKIQWLEEPGRLLSMRSQRVGHD